MSLILLILISPMIAFGMGSARLSCDEILRQLDRMDAGKVRGFVPSLQITVKNNLKLEDLEPQIRARLAENIDDMALTMVGGSKDTPLGFRVLWMRVYDRHLKREKPLFSLPRFWQTPPHGYDLTPDVFPKGHREMHNPASYTQVISPLSRELWEIVTQSDDVVVSSPVDNTSNRFNAALKKQERLASRNKTFRLELADAAGEVLLRAKVNGMSSDAFFRRVSRF